MASVSVTQGGEGLGEVTGGPVRPRKRRWGHRTQGAGVQTDGLEQPLPQREPALRPLGLGIQPPEGRSGKVRSVSRRPWAGLGRRGNEQSCLLIP